MCLVGVCESFRSLQCGKILQKFHSMGVTAGYAHSQSQAVILQVFCVGDGAVRERGVGDEQIVTKYRSRHILSNTNIAIASID